MAQTALQNIATSTVNAPYASTGLGGSGTRVHTFTKHTRNQFVKYETMVILRIVSGYQLITELYVCV